MANNRGLTTTVLLVLVAAFAASFFSTDTRISGQPVYTYDADELYGYHWEVLPNMGCQRVRGPGQDDSRCIDLTADRSSGSPYTKLCVTREGSNRVECESVLSLGNGKYHGIDSHTYNLVGGYEQACDTDRSCPGAGWQAG